MRSGALVLSGRRILLPLLLEKCRFERAVVARVAPNREIGNVPCGLADPIEKFAIVRDHQHRRRLPLEPRFEPHDRVEVEVIGRLVEQQQIGRTKQGTRQRKAVAPATGEIPHWPCAVGLCKAQSMQNSFGRRSDRAFLQFRQRRVRVRKSHRVVLRLGGNQLRASRGQWCMTAQHVRNRRVVGRFDVLCDMRDALGRRRFDRAAVDRQLAKNRSKQR